MNAQELDKIIQSFVANESISASTLRSQGAKGVVAIARQYLSDLNLQTFAVSNQEDFNSQLDKCTTSLQNHFPKGARNWGAARKALNIFLRNSFYNQFLFLRFNLSSAIAFYEVPMDSIVANELKEFDKHMVLPKWPGVKYLDKQTNAIYQSFLGQIAEQFAIKRVHLDVVLLQRLGRNLTRRSS
jgi:hypothetical protein